MQYIAQTLLYDKTLVNDVDAETGQPITRERGYIEIGQPIELSDDRAEILLAVGAIAPAPVVEPAQAVDAGPPELADTSKRRQRA